MRRFHVNLDYLVYPNWCTRIWCIRECFGIAAMSQMAMVCNDLYEHLIYQCSSVTVANWMYQVLLIFPMLSIEQFHWLEAHPNRQRALLWFSFPSSFFLYVLLWTICGNKFQMLRFFFKVMLSGVLCEKLRIFVVKDPTYAFVMIQYQLIDLRT